MLIRGFGSEDAGGSSEFGTKKQTSVRFGLSSMQQSSETLLSLATLGIFAAQQRDAVQFAWAISVAALMKPSQSFAVAVEALAGLTEEQHFVSLTEDDYQRFIAARNKLTDVIGEDENHLLTPLMHFILNLIKKYEETFKMTTLPEMPDEVGTTDPWEALLSLEPRGIKAAYGEDEHDYTADEVGTTDPWEALLSLEPRGIEAAYGEDEHDYTADMPVEGNSDDV